MDLITTIGPSSWDPDAIAAHLRLGVTCIRFPFSKLRPEDHVERCRMLRGIARTLGAGVLTMADLPGGKPRLQSHHPVHVESHRRYCIWLNRAQRRDGDLWLEPGLSGVTFRPDDEVVIGDGENRFLVHEASRDHVVGAFAAPCTLEWQRAFIPAGIDLDVPVLTDKDKACAELAHAASFDWVALSCVRSSDDVASARAWLSASLDWTPRLVAKIETVAGVSNADAIIRAADAVMIARGDLALQIGFERLWSAQQTVLEACLRRNRYCIVATGFLESLARHHTPTRAECIDFCSTLSMGASAILFSSETSIGHNPILVVETALRLGRQWEQSHRERHCRPGPSLQRAVEEAVR